MTISAVPAFLQNGSHSADLFRQAVSSFVPPGGGLVTAGDFAVTQTGTASMNVLVGVGRAWVPGTNVGNVTGGNFSKQAMYFALNDAAATVSVATSDPTNPRIDVAYLAIQDSQYAGTTNTAVLGVATGVPTSGATYPTNAPSIPSNAIALAWINVTAGAASIDNAHITQLATRGLPQNAIPAYRANAVMVGSSTNLNTNLTNNANQPYTQGGTLVATTDAAGNVAISYPTAFPNGVITAVVCNGDSNTGNIIMAISGAFTQNLTTLYVNAKVANTGAVVGSATVRINWTATGW